MQERNIEKALSIFKNMKVGLLLDNNQFVEGVLLDVKQDHLVVDVNQNVFYFALKHVHALSKNARDFHISPKTLTYLDRNYLEDILIALRYNWITINRFSNQLLYGVLSRISEDHIILINKDEQLYVQKSGIANIYNGTYEMNEQNADTSQEKSVQDSVPHTNDATKEQSLDEEIQSSQQENQVTIKQIQTTNDSELEKYVEAPIAEKQVGEITEVEDFIMKHPEAYSEPEIEGEPNLSQLEKHDFLKKEDGIEQLANIRQETAIQAFISHINNETKEQSHSILEEIQDSKSERQVAIKQIQTTNNSESEKYVETPIMEKHAGEVTEVENVTNGHLELRTASEIEGAPSLLQLSKLDYENKVKVLALEVDHQDVFESASSVMSEEQFIFTESQFERNERKILLSEWSTTNSGQQATASQNTSPKERELPDPDWIPAKKKKRSERIKKIAHPEYDNNKNNKSRSDENFEVLDEKSNLIETNISTMPIRKISLEEEKAILKKQYYALMKHAEVNSIGMEHRSEHTKSLIQPIWESSLESNRDFGILSDKSELTKTNTFHIPVSQMSPREVRTMIEKQYSALMRHAAKMYHQLED